LITAAKLGEVQGFLAEEETEELENFENHAFPIQGVYFALMFNLDHEKLQDVELRQKLEKVLDIEEIIINKGIFVQGPISRSPFTNIDLNFDRYDENFKEDLSGTKLTITIPDIKKHRDEAKVIRNMWEDRLGVEVEILKVDPDRIVEEIIVPRDYEILLYGQEISRDPDRYVNWHSTQKEHPGLNLAKFEQVRADRALEEGRREIENEKRIEHYNQFQRVVVDEVPAIFLYHPYKNYFVSNYIEGIGEKYTFTVSDRFLDFANWARVRTN
jgi:ABC-type transport system substrate-binding protein